jgi:N utilization substance protein B
MNAADAHEAPPATGPKAPARDNVGTQTGRVRARRAALQALYQWQLSGLEPTDIVAEFAIDREVEGVDMDYFAELVRQIPAHIEVLERLIDGLLDRRLCDVDPVERAALWIGTYELSHRPEIPWRVVINEAIELTKRFGAVDGHKYVNGILHKLAASLRPTEVAAAGRG